MLPSSHLTLLSGFGRIPRSLSYLYRPTNVEQIKAAFDLARRHGMTVGLRGSGRSYGDAPTNAGHIVLDLRRMNR
ncbi:MAG: FAD-binding protein, partial [Anaerolineae bacterium]